MFIGHYAVGFASKRVAARTSLGLLVMAASLPDLIWPALVLAGVEVVRIDPGNTAVAPLDLVFYPYSHSLLFAACWAAILAGVYFFARGYRTGALVLAAGVVSHWVLDVISHRPDMPLYPGSVKIGLGLWNSVAGTAIVEATLFVVGVWLYARTTRPRNAVGRWALWTLVALLAIVYAMNLMGSPPPSVRVLALVDLTGWLIVVWAWWIDRNRKPARESESPTIRRSAVPG